MQILRGYEKMRYIFNSRFVLEAKNSVEAWDNYLKHLVLEYGMDYGEALKLTKLFEMKEKKRGKKK